MDQAVLEKELEGYPRVTEIIDKTIVKDPKLIEHIIAQEKKGVDTRKTFKQAGEKGTVLHAISQKLLTDQEVKLPSTYEKSFNLLQQHLKDEDYTVLETETLLYGDIPIKHKGHADYILKNKRGNIIISDLKTGRPSFKWHSFGFEVVPRKEHVIQLYAYRHLYQQMNPNHTVEGLELWYLRNNGLDTIPIVYCDGVWDSVLRLYQWLYL